MTRLDRRLILEAPEPVPDGAGGFATAWTPLGTLWGEVAHGPPKDREVPAGAKGAFPVRVTCRAAPPGAPSRPKPGQRLREGTRLYRIVAVAEAGPDGRRLTCFAQEEVGP